MLQYQTNQIRLLLLSKGWSVFNNTFFIKFLFVFYCFKAAQVGCQPSYPTVFNVTRLSCSSNTSFSIPVTATNGTFSATIRSLRVNQPNCSIEFNWGNPSGHSPTEHYSFSKYASIFL